MRITAVLTVPAAGAYYYDDLAALQAHPMPTAETYVAPSITLGYRSVRQVAEGVSVGLVLDGAQVVWGDCISVCYSGEAGRDPLFQSASGIVDIQSVVAPAFRGSALLSFREMSTRLAGMMTSSGSRLHAAVYYGVSQALLAAVATVRGLTMAEVVAEEYGLPVPSEMVPVHAQCGADRRDGVDKMIARRIASLPHTLVSNIPEHLGEDGAVVYEYATWLRERIPQLAGDDYCPTVHLDMHGALGKIYGGSLGKILGYLYRLEQAVAPYPLRVESPVIMESRKAQMEVLGRLRDYVRRRRMRVQLVADEWANTLEDIKAFVEAQAADMIQIKMPNLGSVHNAVEAVLACNSGAVKAFLGGSCAETDQSARVACHIALATRPEIVMAKPGMGVDEAIMLAQNEMARTLAWIGARIEG